MNLRSLLTYLRKACEDFSMIEDNDKIAVAVSGGKDSLALLYGLKEMQRFYPKKYELMAITVDLGFKDADFSNLINFYKNIDVDYKIIKTDIAEIIFENRKEKNPCSLCSKMKKGLMNQYIKDIGFSKIALGHNKNDLIETLIMSLFLEARIHCFSANVYLDRIGLQQIRPLIYASEDEIIKFAKNYDLAITPSNCPVDGRTKREEVKNTIKTLSIDYDSLEHKLFKAIVNSNISGYGSEKFVK